MASPEKHLLVTISEDVNALFGLRYVHGFFSMRDRLRLTLFSVSPKPTDELGFNVLDTAPFCGPGGRDSGRACRQPPPALEAARDWLAGMGFPPDRVTLKAASRQIGTVKDIVAEAEDGLYDAVVLGRRGLSWFEEMFQDSVSHRLLWESITVPLWLCHQPRRGGENVLLCVDGSEQSLRVADHVGYMLQGEPRHQVTLLHNMADARPGADGVEKIMAQAGQILADNGLEAERVSYLVKSSPDTAGLILREAKAGGYAAVAVGRTGGKPKPMGHIFGTTSLKLLRNLEGSALWVCK